MHPQQAREVLDIHGHDRGLTRDLITLATDERLLAVNRTTIRDYVERARDGRLVARGRGRPVSAGRCRKLLTVLRRFGIAIDVPFASVDADTMERFIVGLDDGTVTKLKRIHGTLRYSPESVLDFKKIIRQFYRWLLKGDANRIADLTDWFDTRRLRIESNAFDPQLVPRLAKAIDSIQGSALVWTLFDGGFRIAELLNVRLRDDVRVERLEDDRWVCIVEIRISKTFPRTIALPLASEALLFWIRRHPAVIDVDTSGRPRLRDPDAMLFTWSYRYICKRLRDVGHRELNEHLHPHRFRHTSATYWATRLTRYPFCTRFGWSAHSSEADRYIRRSGYLMDQTMRLTTPTVTGQQSADHRSSAFPAESMWHDFS